MEVPQKNPHEAAPPQEARPEQPGSGAMLLTAELATELDRFCEQQKLSFAALLTGALQVLIYRYLGPEEAAGAVLRVSAGHRRVPLPLELQGSSSGSAVCQAARQMLAAEGLDGLRRFSLSWVPANGVAEPEPVLELEYHGDSGGHRLALAGDGGSQYADVIRRGAYHLRTARSFCPPGCGCWAPASDTSRRSPRWTTSPSICWKWRDEDVQPAHRRRLQRGAHVGGALRFRDARRRTPGGAVAVDEGGDTAGPYRLGGVAGEALQRPACCFWGLNQDQPISSAFIGETARHFGSETD